MIASGRSGSSYPARTVIRKCSSALGEFLEGLFAAEECVLPTDGLQDEAFEVAEVVEGQAGDLSGVFCPLSMPTFAALTMLGPE